LVINRKLNPLSDFFKLQLFLAEMRNHVSQAGYFHLGDLIFRIYKKSNNFDIDKDFRIWEDNDKIIGFVLYIVCECNPEFQIRKEYYNTSISREMLEWTIKRAKELEQNKIEVSCLDIDHSKREFLENSGFKCFDDPFVCMESDLSQSHSYLIPNDYSFVSLKERADLYSITGEETVVEYENNILQSVYLKDDLFVHICYQNQQIVTGCICWYDNVDNCGLFEPVGTNELHRRKGLSFACMAKAMDNLKNYGAKKAYVHTHGENAPAIKLYEKLGFVITNHDYGFEYVID
jgi:GNAT superfamily N-acetyltransferase